MNSIIKILINLIISFLIHSTAVYANYRFTHLTIKEGLSQSTVKSICQDWRGFIWFGTADGLNKFDGYNLLIYRNEPGKNGSICGNDISCIYENPYDSTLWIGTRNDGFSLYNRITDQFYSFRKTGPEDHNVPSNNINSIVSLKRGELWIGTQGSGLIWFNLSDTTFAIPDFSKSEEFRNINTLLTVNNETLWLGTPSGLYKYSIPDEKNFYKTFPEPVPLPIPEIPSIISLNADKRGNLWIGTSNTGLIRYHTESGSISHYFYDPNKFNSIGSNTVRAIELRKNGTIWIGTDNGLFKFNPQNEYFRAFRNDPSDMESISDDVVFSLYEDRSGVLWLGTFFGGVNRVDPEESRFTKYSNFHKLFQLNKATNHVGSLYKDAENSLWVATSKGLILLTGNYFKQPEIAENAKIIFRDIYQYYVFGDSYQNLYVSNMEGLFIKKGGNNQFEPLIPSNHELNQFEKFVSHAIEDSDRMVWFFTSAGLIKYNPKMNEAELYNPKNKNGANTRTIFISGYESYNGKIWCGTNDGTIYLFDRYIYQFEKILPEPDKRKDHLDNRIFSIHETEPGIIWYGTNNGLYQYNNKEASIKRYLTGDGLSNNVVYAVLPDNQKRIWCSTNLGISVLDLETNSFVNYTWEDGLQSNEFNQSAYFKSNDGLFYFGGIDGINIINPSSINPNPFIPPVVITGISVNHEKINPFTHRQIIDRHITEAKTITLKHNQAIFTFEFAALNYIHSDKNQYRYKLAGYDKVWITEGNARTATYTNIPPGEYTFMVQGSNNSGLWNDVPASIKVIIVPPFWAAWWFKTLVVLMFVSLLYLFIYIRLREQRIKNEWLQRQIDEKTVALTENKIQIERQLYELKKINEDLNERNQKIHEKNQKLNYQNEQIIKQHKELLELTDKLEKANQSKLNFFTRISQEFRTPLLLIMEPIKELLENSDKISKEFLIKKFNIIYANAAKLLTLVNQILDFREHETVRQQLKLSRVDLVRFIREINFLFNDFAQRKNITFDFTSQFPILEICIDHEKIEKVITNLISNVFAFSKDGCKINIDLTTTTKNDGSKFVVIKIADNTKGIPPENLSFIFEEPYDFANPGYRDNLGISLALAKQYTELHGGKISYSNELDAGSVFTVTIPLLDNCLSSETIKGIQKYNYSKTIAASLYDIQKSNGNLQFTEDQSIKLVIIENDPGIRNYLTDVLSDRYRIFSAGTIADGTELISSKHPDLIISNVSLPDQTGYELCLAIKENYATCHIPVILLSSTSDIKSQIRGLESGADSYIIVPFDLHFFEKTIYNLITLRKRIQSKYYFDINTESIDTKLKNDEKQFIEKVITEIEKNIHDPEFDVEKLCKALGLSQPQTYRKIKTITDLSISELIRNTRLKKATRLFAEHNLTVSEVAYQVGFNDPNYFTKCFTKVFGQTPTEYLKLKREIG